MMRSASAGVAYGGTLERAGECSEDSVYERGSER